MRFENRREKWKRAYSISALSSDSIRELKWTNISRGFWAGLIAGLIIATLIERFGR